MASGFANCRDCPSRAETGTIPVQIIRQTRLQHAREQKPLISHDGIRGVFLNELTREQVARLTEHLLEMVNEAFVASHERPSGDRQLRVLTGHDSRSSSPELAIGAVAVMKRWGCDIADLGCTTRPILDYTLTRFRPDLCLLVTGGNEPVAWNGLDVIEPDGVPWSFPGRLMELQARLHRTSARIARRQGCYTPLPISSDYELALADQFHAIRPLRLAFVCPDPLVKDALQQILEQTPCSALFLNASKLQADARASTAPRFKELLGAHRIDAGFQIGSDGRSCRLLDESGDGVPVEDHLQLLARGLHAPAPHILLRAPSVPESMPNVQRMDGTEADLVHAQRAAQSPLAADADGRFWFLDGAPACDAIQTVARTLEAISLSERPTSSYRRETPPVGRRPLRK